jgi:PAS domain-containing protein
VWEEIWDIIGPQIAQVMSGGGATWHENALVPITRNGRREEVYWTYSYSPIDDSAAATGVGGVLVVCTETTQQVLSARQAAEEQQKFSELFEQAPSFMAMLRGPEHRFELANPSYLRLIGRRGCARPDRSRGGPRSWVSRAFSSCSIPFIAPANHLPPMG